MTNETKPFSEPRAGIIPYIWDENKNAYIYMFMMPSDAKYGGAVLQIAKGVIEDTEHPEISAIREGEEELGLKRGNIIDKPFEFFKSLQITAKDKYSMSVFAVEIKNKKDFNKPHFETKFTTWVTAKRFNEIGRKGHREIVTELENILTKQRKNT